MKKQPHQQLFQATDALVDKLERKGFFDIGCHDAVLLCSFWHKEKAIQLYCKLPPTFPYDFPHIYLEDQCLELFRFQPHIGLTGKVCVFDENASFPNFKEPTEVILRCLVEARRILKEGETKKNQCDYIDEFSAYWGLKENLQGTFKNLALLSSKPKILTTFSRENLLIFADNKENLSNFLVNTGIRKYYNYEFSTCLYLPLKTLFLPPYPVNNLELYNALSENTLFRKDYDKYLVKHLSKSAPILFSLADSTSVYYCSHGRTKLVRNGFRIGKVPPRLAFLAEKQSENIIRASVTNINQKRLFFRGGEGLVENLNSVAIVGCGSLGGYCAEALAEFGLTSFVLIDKEKIQEENIARHYCGYRFLNFYKVSAVQNKLTEHNPNISCECFQQDAHQFFEKHLTTLSKCNVVICTTANFPLEYKLVSLFHEIRKPLVLLWVEPHLFAGHGMVIQENPEAWNNLFEENYDFKHAVLKNGADFLKREAGCQTTFTPYSAFDLKQFLYSFLSYFVKNTIENHEKGDYLFTWCGELSSVGKFGGKLNVEWENTKDYTFHVKRLFP